MLLSTLKYDLILLTYSCLVSRTMPLYSYMVFVVAVATTVTFGRLQTAPGIPIYEIGAKLFGVTHPQTHNNILDLVIWIPIAVHVTCDVDVCDFIYIFMTFQSHYSLYSSRYGRLQ